MTATIVGIDLVVAAAVGLLRSASMAVWFAAVAADRADGLEMWPAFEYVYDHEIDPETTAYHFFAIVTAPRADRDTPYGGGGDHSTDELTNRINIGVVLTGDDPSLMTKQVQRAIVAVRECMKAHLMSVVLPYSARAGDLRLGTEDYEPLSIIPGDNNILMKAGTIDLAVPMIS